MSNEKRSTQPTGWPVVERAKERSSAALAGRRCPICEQHAKLMMDLAAPECISPCNHMEGTGERSEFNERSDPANRRAQTRRQQVII